ETGFPRPTSHHPREEQLMKLSHLIREVCRLDCGRCDFEAVELNKRYPGERFLSLSAYADLPTAPQEQQLRDLLTAQSPAALYMLVTVWRFGRGEFTPCLLFDEYVETGDAFANVTEAVDYLMGKSLSCHLEDGTEAIKSAGIDVDALLG